VQRARVADSEVVFVAVRVSAIEPARVFHPCRPCANSTLSISSPRISRAVSTLLGGIFDFDIKQERLDEVLKELEDPKVWDNPEKAQSLGRERTQLEGVVSRLIRLDQAVSDAADLLELAVAEDDEDTVDTVALDLDAAEREVAGLEFRRMFSREADPNNAFLDIQAGSGGTEAQDWAEMLERMYLRWGERRGFKTELIEESPGDVAGIKSATIRFEGDYAYGWLRTETGVHRLVRKSPFDSGNRRHTSFASVFVSPEVDDSIDIDINPADLRVDVYRASGAGGQHVNRTESAVRITHNPTGVVVQCQSERSQHANRDRCMKQLRAKLYELEIQKRNAEKQALEATKSDIGWGSQIRSYVLDQSRIKDLRTNWETGNPQTVLDGDLDPFIEESLKSGL
jgi:peptide chain release factor 2